MEAEEHLAYLEVLLGRVLTAQVLCLAKAMKAEAKARGVTSTSDFISEAASRMKKDQARVLSLLR